MQISGDEHACQVVFTAEYESSRVSEEKANRMLGNVYRAQINAARTDLGIS